MRVLWVATKAPLPASDGGRAVMGGTLAALAAAGGDVTLVAPADAARFDRDRRYPNEDVAALTSRELAIAGVRTFLVDARPRGWPRAASRSLASGLPVTIERHSSAAMIARVESLVRTEPFDVVHVEQLQALAIAAPARRSGAACVLRAQNVESAVWAAAAPDGSGRGPAAVAARHVWHLEVRRLRRFETAALGEADVTIALSPTDAAHLSRLNPTARVVSIPPPASIVADAAGPLLEGEPAFSWIGSPGWPPNDRARQWLLNEIWPAMRARLPDARLHVFGSRSARNRSDDRDERTDAGIVWHDAPRDSAAAFAGRTTLLLPLRTAAGVRMRLLEAWGRGVPVIATPEAADGLDTTDGRNLLLAAGPWEFADAASRLVRDPGLRARLVDSGRETIVATHDPGTVARRTLEAYREAIATRAAAKARV